MPEPTPVPNPAPAPAPKSDDTPIHIGVNVYISLLGRDIEAIYEKSADHHRVLVSPTDFTDHHPVSFETMINQFKSVLGMSDQDANNIGEQITSLDEGGKIDLKKITVDLETMYLYISYKTGQPKGQMESSEFALSIKVSFEDALPDLGFIQLHSISLKLWKLPDSIDVNRFMQVEDLQTAHDKLIAG